MKKLISLLSLTLFIGVVTASAQCCNSKTDKNSTNNKVDCTDNQKLGKVEAYYFHATHRCATCQAVESVTREALKEYYGDKVSFKSINSEKEKDNLLIEKYKVSGQTLLIIKGNKVTNLTNEAFMYARTNPDKLKAKIKSTVDPLI